MIQTAERQEENTDMAEYDLIVIGAGPGGYSAAIAAAQHGMKAALVEKRDIGGTCLNRGCIPTKTLIHLSDLVRDLHAETAAGVLQGDISCNFEKLYERKNEVTKTLQDGILALLKGNGVDIYQGEAKVAGPDTVVVSGPEGEQKLSCARVMIAAGSRPSRLPVPGADLPGIYDSDSFFEHLPDRPGRLAVVGGGVIGVEIASIYEALGFEVTILEMLPKLLGPMDKELAQNLSMIMKKRGVRVETGAAVSGFSMEQDQLTVHYANKQGDQELPADWVLVCTGRRAAAENLFDESCMPKIERGIVVDEHFESTIPGIYAIGDVTAGEMKLAHMAEAQAVCAVEYMAGKNPSINLSVVPSVVYTSPEIAAVGLSEEEARQTGFTAKSSKATMYGNAKTLIARQERSFMKIIYEEGSGIVLGAQLMCAHASDIIGEFAAAVAKKLTIDDMASIIRAHPTFAEAATDVYDTALGHSIRSMPKKTAR